MNMVLHLQFATQIYSLGELDLSIEYLLRTVVVELFVEDVLRDLIHQNRIFCDSSELDFL